MAALRPSHEVSATLTPVLEETAGIHVSKKRSAQSGGQVKGKTLRMSQTNDSEFDLGSAHTHTLSNKMKSASHTLKRMGTATASVGIFFIGRTPSGQNDIDEEDDEELTEAERVAIQTSGRRSKRRSQMGVMTAEDMANLRRRVLEKMGLDENMVPDRSLVRHGVAPNPQSVLWQRRLGILWLRVQIAIKKLHVEESKPRFPTARMVVKNLKFEAVIAGLIIINAMSIGAMAMYSPADPAPAYLGAAEHVFICIFLIEWILRVMAYSWAWIFSPMNLFDTFLIWGTGVIMTWLMGPLQVDATAMQRLSALRVLRLGRLCRAVRMIQSFRELWTLVQGILTCMPLLFWAGIIIGVVHFCFAVAVVEIISKSDEYREDPFVQRYFGDLFGAMFTLFQIMCFDSWIWIVRPIVENGSPTAAPLFILFIGIAGIVLFNLMTAIVVKNAFEAADADEEAVAMAKLQQRTKMTEELKGMFKDLDDDGSGSLTREEFADCVNDVLFVQKMKMLDIDLEELPDIFDILDDGDGSVTTDEFCDGIHKLQGGAKSKDILKATQRMKSLNEGMVKISEQLGETAGKVFEDMDYSLECTSENMHEMHAMCAELLQKMNDIGLKHAVRQSTKVMPRPPEWPVAPHQKNVAKRHSIRHHEVRLSPAAIKAREQNPASFMEPIPATFLQQRRQIKQSRKKSLVEATREGASTGGGEDLRTAATPEAMAKKLAGSPGEFLQCVSWESALEHCASPDQSRVSTASPPLSRGSTPLRIAALGTPDKVRAAPPPVQAPLLHPHAVPAEGTAPQWPFRRTITMKSDAKVVKAVVGSPGDVTLL